MDVEVREVIVAKAAVAKKCGAVVEIVGAWVWAYFSAKPDTETRETLKAEHFRWNPRRGCW
jgi:hypothetical protein